MMIINSSPRFSRIGIMKAQTAAMAMPKTITLRRPARSESLPITGCMKARMEPSFKSKTCVAELNREIPWGKWNPPHQCYRHVVTADREDDQESFLRPVFQKLKILLEKPCAGVVPDPFADLEKGSTSKVGRMIQCRISRQSIDANRNPTITGPTTAESVPPMAWNPKACHAFADQIGPGPIC